VHFPIVLALFVPALALILTLGIRTGRFSPRAWGSVALLHVLLVGSAWVALETGEQEEEHAERVVAESLIEGHEEAAQRFALLAALGLPLAAAGLLRGSLGDWARPLATAASAAALAAVVLTGHSGGELVYRHGAAQAHVQQRTDPPRVAHQGPGRAHETREHEDDDDD
jgi:uncharacterized membrane protein